MRGSTHMQPGQKHALVTCISQYVNCHFSLFEQSRIWRRIKIGIEQQRDRDEFLLRYGGDGQNEKSSKFTVQLLNRMLRIAI